MIIIDASVAVKWLIPEANSDQALALAKGSEILVAPDLIRTEVAGAITKRFRLGEIELDDAKEALGMWVDALKEGVIQVQTTLEDVRHAANFSLQLNHPIQDCLYLALAQRNSSRLATADRKFADKAKSVFPGIDVI
ncbi:MAG: type II toxin-antitoxin system VapC family toxin [Acidobacteria bacterium]|nr:type II toxin-antitoxin system VapC family toxin [Acidobacteriota bacterium]